MIDELQDGASVEFGLVCAGGDGVGGVGFAGDAQVVVAIESFDEGVEDSTGLIVDLDGDLRNGSITSTEEMHGEQEQPGLGSVRWIDSDTDGSLRRKSARIARLPPVCYRE